MPVERNSVLSNKQNKDSKITPNSNIWRQPMFHSRVNPSRLFFMQMLRSKQMSVKPLAHSASVQKRRQLL